MSKFMEFKTLVVDNGVACKDFLLNQEGVVKVEYVDQTSSSGSWHGLFVQKVKDKNRDVYYKVYNFDQEFQMSGNYVIQVGGCLKKLESLSDFTQFKEQYDNESVVSA